jgi:hypothetical protein
MNRTSIFSSLLFLILMLTPAAAQKGAWSVQLASYQIQAEAETQTQWLQGKGQDAYIVKSTVAGQGIRYRVRIGRFASKAAAQSHGDKLKREGIIADYFAAPYESPLKPAPEKAAASAPAAPAKAAKTTPPVAQPVTPVATQAAASLSPSASTATSATSTRSGKVKPRLPTTKEASALPGKSAVSAVAASGRTTLPAGFKLYEDKEIGFSFHHPTAWSGSAWGRDELSAQNIDAGASFKSREDAAFLNAIWNKLEDASNDSRYDNTLLVDTILKSMGSGSDTQEIKEVSRKVEKSNDQIRTYLDLIAFFRDPNSTNTLNFNGKALITRCRNGILLLVVFYSADAPATTASKAQQIILSARAPG